jgi:hypothetical protein
MKQSIIAPPHGRPLLIRRGVTLALWLAWTVSVSRAEAQEKQPARGVISIREVVIVGRVQKPVASVDVNKLQPKLTLADLKQPLVDRIEEAVHHDPF